MERGIVVSQSKYQISSTGFSVTSGLDTDELRYFILYWDKVAIPADSYIYFEVDNEDFLISEGVLERPMSRLAGVFSGPEMAIAAIEAHAKVAADKMGDKRTDWVIHQFGDDLIVPASVKASQQILRFDLLSALPVPSGAVAIADILEFKSRRLDEFKALHECIDELYGQILLSPDQSLSTKKAISRLISAVADIEKSQKDRFSFFKKFDFTIETDGRQLSELGPAAVGLIADLGSGGASLGIPSLVGGVMSALGYLKVTTKPGDFFASAKGKNKLAYLSGAKKEGLLR